MSVQMEDVQLNKVNVLKLKLKVKSDAQIILMLKIMNHAILNLAVQ